MVVLIAEVSKSPEPEACHPGDGHTPHTSALEARCVGVNRQLHIDAGRARCRVEHACMRVVSVRGCGAGVCSILYQGVWSMEAVCLPLIIASLATQEPELERLFS